MTTRKGKSLYRDICIGRLVFYRGRREVQRREAADAGEELRRFEEAVAMAKSQLHRLYERSVQTVGEANAAIFQVQELLLEDGEYLRAVKQGIAEGRSYAEYAVWEAGQRIAGKLRALEDDYIRERDQDILDVTDRLLGALAREQRAEAAEEPFILAARDLLPSQVVQLSAYPVQGLALGGGRFHSHTAILARSMGIPVLMQLGEDLEENWEGKTAAIDGFEGVLYLDPDEGMLEKLEEKKREAGRRRKALEGLKGKENITRGGQSVKLYANAGSLVDVEEACANDAGGIGLLRSELLYLESPSAPGEEQQFSFYRQVLERMGEKEVVIRTFDIGADKMPPWLCVQAEENPALGLKSIRLGLERPQLLKTQLRALYRAGVSGNLRIMYPMITSVEEVLQLKQIEEQVQRELAREGIPYARKIPTGIMIETPAAAVLADLLAEEVDFFSVGTNDLTQYTLALDRQNEALERFADPDNKAVLRLVEFTVKCAHRAGIWAGVCGELAADTAFTEAFLRMGVDELSVSPGMVLELREKIREL